jgi:riboflavin kinase / FMN adenylyltransferase
MQIMGPGTSTVPSAGAAVTIGAYDGVHLGHRSLLAELATLARDRHLETVVVTFDRHPATVVRPDSAPLVLTDLEQKLELLAEVGIDRVYVIPFNEERSHEPAEEFVREVLVDDLCARVVVVGPDFHFGHRRAGNLALLEKLGTSLGFATFAAPQARSGEEPISSTRIRSLVAAGEVSAAARLLGRNHELRATVVHGDGRGGPELGFPTANLDVPTDIAVPGVGIYAGWYRRPDGERVAAAISVGFRPTFAGITDRPLVEAFLLDVDVDLYGEHARLSFVERIRDEERFASPAELKAQIARDVQQVRELLAPGR